MEILTLAQTRKLSRRVPVLLYGSEYWNEVVNFGALVRHGVISPEDTELFHFADTPQSALDVLTAKIEAAPGEATPAFAASRTPPASDLPR